MLKGARLAGSRHWVLRSGKWETAPIIGLGSFSFPVPLK